MKTRLAICSCGQLSAECSGEPQLISACHCRACQKRTGSAMGIVAFFEAARVITTGEATSYSRPSDSGYDVVHSFCPICGSTVFWRALRKPDHIAVAVGAFADPDFPAPQKAVYRDDAHPWVSVTLRQD